jgi:hypothetical protein
MTPAEECADFEEKRREAIRRFEAHCAAKAAGTVKTP